MITVAQARAAIDRIVAATEAAGFVVAIAIVDDHGDLVAAHRMDGCRPRWMRVSQRKAYTSAVMDKDTAGFHDEIVRRQLQIVYYGDPMFTALPGGIPILAADGSTLGGIGVTGLTNMRDAELGAAGLPCFAEAVHSPE